MVPIQSYDSPPGLSIESAREADQGLPGVGRLTVVPMVHGGLAFVQWGQQSPTGKPYL